MLKACLFTAVSSEVFDHCKLYRLMTINFLLYAEAKLFLHIIYCFLGLETGAPFFGLAKSINDIHLKLVMSRLKKYMIARLSC